MSSIAGMLALVVRLNRSRLPLFLVGGAVRDLLLGREAHDLDFVADGDPRSLASSLADHLHAGFYPLDEERGTFRVVLDSGGLVVDFATLRAPDLESDLRVRDFTINAIALDPNGLDFEAGQFDLDHPPDLIDPCGGLEDLRARRLRACSPDSFSSDPVRPLRAVRQSISLGMNIEPQTLRWAKEAAPLIGRVSPERVRDELFRMLETPQAAACLRLMRELDLIRVIPEVGALFGVEQSPPHVQPVWEHTLEVLERLDLLWSVLVEDGSGESPDDPFLAEGVRVLGAYRHELFAHFADRLVAGRSLRGLLAFAALYHDIAKPSTRAVEPSGKIRFLQHEEIGSRLAAERARSLAFSADEVTRVKTIISGHMRIHQLAQAGSSPPTCRAIYRYFRATGPAGIDICLLSLADTWATYSHTLTLEIWRQEVETCRILFEAQWNRADQLVSPPKIIDGNDLQRELNLKPGPHIGRLLEAVREAQVEGEVTERKQALEFARRILEDLV